MEFSLIELNELIYAVGTASRYGNLVDKKVANKLWARLNDELESRMKLYDLAENGPETESMFDDIWTECHDKQLLDEAGAVQRWG